MAKFWNSIKLMGSAVSFRVRDSRRKTKDLEFRREALYNESFMKSSLRSELEDILRDMDSSERTVSCVVIHVQDKAIQYMTEVTSKLDCTLTPCATPGLYLLEREQVFL